MQFRSVLRRALLLCLLPAAFAACDRHEAGEPPENYGHGSSHDKSYTDHHIDSTGATHFSDSAGANEKTAPAAPAAPAEKPAGEGQKRLNPGGQ